MVLPKPSSGPTTFETADSDSGDGDTVSVHISGADVSVLVGEGGAAGVVEDLDLRIEIPRLGRDASDGNEIESCHFLTKLRVTCNSLFFGLTV